MAYVISSISMKGSVGKTTLVLCLGTGLANQGKKVLLLNLDAQGSLSIAMGCAYSEQGLAMTGGGEQFLKRFLSLLLAYGKEYDYPAGLSPVIGHGNRQCAGGF